MKNDGGYAFPCATIEGWENGTKIYVRREEGGMSLRDYFATAALKGFLADSSQRRINEEIKKSTNAAMLNDNEALVAAVNAQLAYGCYKLADAMLAERSK